MPSLHRRCFFGWNVEESKRASSSFAALLAPSMALSCSAVCRDLLLRIVFLPLVPLMWRKEGKEKDIVPKKKPDGCFVDGCSQANPSVIFLASFLRESSRCPFFLLGNASTPDASMSCALKMRKEEDL